ncbi:MAG: hypothetical protein J6T27_01625 [Alphaproteobacteria bacterium]|nr:hypothetical protein [Alphaproteobacteria bacterium]
MKKFLIALFAIFACGKTFAAGPMVPQAPIFVFADVLEYAIKKNFSVMDYDAVTQEWEKRMSADGTVTATDIEAVCKIGRLDKNACIKFRDDLMTYFYPICEKTATKGKSNCVDDFWATIRGTWVRLSEAIGIAQEYAQLKNKETVVCSPKTRQVNPPARASYLKCTSVDGGHYYEFKFNSTTETNDRDIISGTLRAVGKMHNIEFQNSDCTLERIASDSNCALAYKTSDIGQCEKINKSLKRFGYSSKIITTEKFGKRCEVFGITGGKRSAYGIDNTVFQDVQYVAGPEVENRIKAYVQKELSQQNIKLEKFSCDKTTKHDYTNVALDGLIKKHSEILTCYVNGSPIDFLFADLSENKDYAKNAGLSKMACVQLGGKVDQKKCRSLDEQECNKLGNRLIARGEQGTKYLQEKGGCILSAAATERAINLAKEIVAGIAITVVTEGTATIPVIVSIVTDLAFEAVQIWQDEIPYKDFKEFMAAAEECENITKDSIFGNDPIKNQKKYCMGSVLNKYAKLMTSQIQNLAPEVQAELIKRMTQISDMVGDQEIVYVIPTAKTMRNYASFALFGGLLVFNPEKWFSKADNTVSEFTRLQLKASKSFKTYALEFLSLGNNVGLPIERLTQSEWATLNRHLSNQGVEMFETIMNGQRVMTFKLSLTGLKSKASQNFDKYLNEFLQTGSSAGLPTGRLNKSEWDELNNLLKSQNVQLRENGGYMYFTRIGAELSDFASLRNKASQNFDKYLNDFLQTGSSAGLPASRLSKSEWDKLNEFLKPQGVQLTARDNGYMYFTRIGNSLSSAKQQLLNLGFRETSNGVLISDKYETIFYDEFNMISNKKAITMGIDGSSNGRQIVVAISDDDAAKLGLRWSDTENDFLTATSENAANLSRLGDFISQRRQLTNIHGNPVYVTEFGARSGRPIVMVEVKGRQIPFYISTGLAGKTTVPTGKWEVFFGIGPTGWFNKGSLSDIENHYGSQELKQIAQALDLQIGDLRNTKYFLNSSGRASYGGQGFVGTIEDAPDISLNIINRDFNYAPGGNGSFAPTRNIIDITEWLRSL